MRLAPGSRLGPYEVVAQIGAGGMGEVYRARDTRLDRTVAIKILSSVDPDLKARFTREAKAIAALTHPHICTLYDVGHDERKRITSSWSISTARRLPRDFRVAP